MIEFYSYEAAVVIDTAIFLLAIGYLALSIDDILLDCFFYVRGVFQGIFGPRTPRLTKSELENKPEARIAILIPCWHEADVVEKMLSSSLEKIAYGRYEIFVGVYPNDAQTQTKIDAVCARSKNVWKIVNSRPGPTTKAQNLNEMIARMRMMEGNDPFDIILLHDVEDLIHPLSLKLYNALIPEYDMVQLPVLPLPHAPWSFTGWTYADEFSENHLKDLVTRAAIGSFIPSAGVGCAFRRSCLEKLSEQRQGDVFRNDALTEDYQLSLDLKLLGCKQIFAKSRVDGEIIATRAFFPDTLPSAIRQKTRWITGICLQAWENQGWPGSLATRYALYRDRKGLLGHLLCFAGYPVMLFALLLGAWHQADPRVAVAVFRHIDAIYDLLYTVIAISIWRIAQRFIQTWRIYGPLAALLSIPRFPWGNIVNGCAMVCAVYGYVRAKARREPLRWAKTQHVFPTDVR